MLNLRVILLLGCLTPIFAQAHSTEHVATVKQMYELGKKLEKGTEIIEMYADEELSYAFRNTPTDEVCIGADIMWNSQDPIYDKEIEFESLPNQLVKVDLAAAQYDEATTLVYRMNCESGTCKVADVITEDGSLKESLQGCAN